MSGHKDILGMRASAKVTEDDEPDGNFYRAYDHNRNGRPAMGVSVITRSGKRRIFWYHDIKFPEYEVRDGEEILSFIDGPIVVILSGTGISAIYDAMHRCTLRAIYEYDGRPTKSGEPIVTTLAISGPSVKDRAEPKLEVVTPAKKAG